MLWHYTVGIRLEDILASGVIRLANGFVEKGERPVVWFSASNAWEETANKGAIDSETGEFRNLSRQETHDYCDGLVRIGVAPETAPYGWSQFVELSGVSLQTANALKKVAHKQGSQVSQWFVSFEPVPKDKWLCIEAWDGSQWKPQPDAKVLDSALEREIISLLKGGKKIAAIELYREKTGVGLKEAKDFIIALAADRRLSIPKGSGCLGVLLLLVLIPLAAIVFGCDHARMGVERNDGLRRERLWPLGASRPKVF